MSDFTSCWSFGHTQCGVAKDPCFGLAVDGPSATPSFLPNEHMSGSFPALTNLVSNGYDT